MPLPDVVGITPLEATRNLLDVSVTERGQFRSCRRRWYLSTIENLQPKGVPSIELDYGTAMHSALEAYYLANGRRELAIAKAHKELDAWVEKASETAQTQEEYESVQNHGEMGHVILDNYFMFDQGSKVQLGDIVAVEGAIKRGQGRTLKALPPDGYPPQARVLRHPSGRLMVPIVDPETKEPLVRADGRVAYLTARIDLLSQRATPKLGLWVTDHKNLGSAPSDKGLDFDDQVTGYCYVVWRWVGVPPRGAIYNALLKQVPEEPRWVKPSKRNPGGLSFAKDQLTMPDLYRDALRTAGLYGSDGRILSEDHAACLNSLLSRGWDPFFRRLEVPRNMDQLLNFERRLMIEYRDMVAAHSDPLGELLYPNPSTFMCSRCPVNRICLAMEDGSDWEYIADTAFVQAPDRKAQ